MNKVILVGRLVQNPELRNVGNSKVCTFDLAVTRRFKNAEGKYDADFIPVVVWGRNGEIIAEKFKKGNKILIIGELRTRIWIDKNNQKHKMFEVNVDDFEFVEPKRDSNEQSVTQTNNNTQNIETIQQNDEIDGFEATDTDKLPF